MALRLYNTRTRQIEPFEPIAPNKVSLYVCGMTPSFHPHLGHARTFITFDVLYRYLLAKGYDVTYVRNVTDIDDRIIERSLKDGVPWNEVVARYYREFEICATQFGLLAPSIEPRATDEMPGIVAFITRLVDLGAAYETGDGVYFAVNRNSRYGELSRRNLDELRAGERIAVREEKRDPLDFALWKKAKAGEPTWQSPWGPGRPGWHIECSAMCRHYLGDQFDIHGGATDLVFPHHENEVAQTETASGRHPMARYWVHAGLLQVDNQKMSKSVGNFIPLTELLQKYPAAAARYLFLQTGYRKPSNFTIAALEAAAKGLRGLYADLEELRTAAKGRPTSVRCAVEAADFDAFIEDDLNTAGALGWLQKKVRDERATAQASDSAHATVALAEYCLNLFGLPPTAEAAGLAATPGRVELSAEQRAALRAIAADGEADAIALEQMDDATLIEHVVARRNRARASKDFSTSDRLRDALARAGVALRDTKEGSEWSLNGTL